MEKIQFSYTYDEGDGSEVRQINFQKADTKDCGLRATDICQMFLDFMISAGFSENNVFDYFKG